MKKILIIEDDERLALALSVRLKANGYATWVAADCITAVSTAVQVKPDLILLDVSLPAGNGLDLIDEFYQLPETSQTPIILATANKDPELRNKALELGASGLLRKPYDPEELLGVVEQVLTSWRVSDTGTFVISNPMTDDPDAPGAKKVLIIEDDQKIAQALAIRMASAGYETFVANDGMTAVRTAVNIKPDVIVLDISLPAGDGFAVAERIQMYIPRPIRIIFLTASKRSDFRKRAEQLGAVAFFEKPYEPKALLTAVERALN
jgi:DNA-binding response OmpR family regulator